MKTFSTALLSLTGLTAVSAAAIEMRREIPEGYAIVPMTWTGPIVPNGENRTFHGTAEAVLDEIRKLNPDFDDFAAAQQQNSSASLAARGLEARQPTRVACDGGGPNGSQGRRALSDDARDGIAHLRWLAGFGCGAAPRSCARMTCNNGAEIWFCNDNDYHIEDRCDWQGYLAELVIDKCQVHIKASCWFPNPHCGWDCGCSDIDDWVVMGAQYDVRNWNVMVTKGPNNWWC